MKEKLEILTGHNFQGLEIWHAGGCIKLDMEKAKSFHQELWLAITEVARREFPPCIPDFMWDEDRVPFANSNPCEAVSPENHSDCGGGVGKHEFSLKEMLKLRDWLNAVLDYHRKCNCPNLKELESGT